MGSTKCNNQGVQRLKEKSRNNRMPVMYGIVSREEQKAKQESKEKRIQDLKDSVENRYN